MKFRIGLPTVFMLTACLILAAGIIYSIVPNANRNFAFKFYGTPYLVGFLQFCAFLGFVCFVAGVGYQYLIKIGRQSETLMKVHITIGSTAAIVSAITALELTRSSRLLENGDLQIAFIVAVGVFLVSQFLYIIALARAI